MARLKNASKGAEVRFKALLEHNFGNDAAQGQQVLSAALLDPSNRSWRARRNWLANACAIR
jgi:hypothetical protein